MSCRCTIRSSSQWEKDTNPRTTPARSPHLVPKTMPRTAESKERTHERVRVVSVNDAGAMPAVGARHEFDGLDPRKEQRHKQDIEPHRRQRERPERGLPFARLH